MWIFLEFLMDIFWKGKTIGLYLKGFIRIWKDAVRLDNLRKSIRLIHVIGK